MNINVAAGEKLALLGTIDPQTVTSTELFTDVIDMENMHQALATACLGDMAAETIDFTCYTCASDGTGAASLKATTQLAAHATNNDNVQLEISLRASELVASSSRYVKFGLKTGGLTGGPACVTVVGVDARFNPASASNLASVKQVKL